LSSVLTIGDNIVLPIHIILNKNLSSNERHYSESFIVVLYPLDMK
jgi:hypothetical protein